MARDRIVFLHLPRTGGVTLTPVLERHYGPNVYFTGASLDPAAVLDALPETTLERLECLAGHFPFGFHKYLRGNVRYITMLRDPVDRIVSHYHSAKQREWHYLHTIVTSQNMSISDYLSSGITTETSNSQTQLLSGREQTLPLDVEDPVSQAVLATAKANLRDHFVVVGIFERYDESVLLFGRKLGWTNITYHQQNKTTRRSSGEELSKEDRDVIVKYNQLDIELYQYALGLFSDTLGQEDESFAIELERYRIANRRYQKLMALYWEPRWFLGRIRRKVRRIISLR